MSRSSGSICSGEAKDISAEITEISGLPYKQNLDYLRLIEQLITFRICEQIRCSKYSLNQDNECAKPTVVVEIPLLGTLQIKPIVFHKTHRLTNKASLHFEFKFEPLSGFKKHILDAYATGECAFPTEFANMYGKKLVDIYTGDDSDNDE